MKISARSVELSHIKVELETADGRTFFLAIDQDGLGFYSSVNSAGNFEGNPIRKSPDDLFAWVADDGRKKKFKDRVGVQPKEA